jgi:hypothetical protein
MGQQVTVACKLPHGLHLDIGDKRVTLNGGNSGTALIVDGEGHGHGLTEVDKEFFDAWRALNADHPALKAELIFAHDKRDSAVAQARSNRKNRTGFEGLDPNRPGSDIAPADEQKNGVKRK